MSTFCRTETHGSSVPSTWFEWQLRVFCFFLFCSIRITIDIILHKWVSNILTFYREFSFKLGSVRTKSCEDNGIRSSNIITILIPFYLHLLPGIVTNKFLTTDIPLCIDRSRGFAGNNVTIFQAIRCLVNRNSGQPLKLVSSNMTAIADILMNRITSNKSAYCNNKQKYNFFHIVYLIIINKELYIVYEDQTKSNRRSAS